jgi:hypothetical protein
MHCQLVWHSLCVQQSIWIEGLHKRKLYPPLLMSPYPGNLQLMEPENFYYLRQSGCVSDPTINDVRDYASVSLHGMAEGVAEWVCL